MAVSYELGLGRRLANAAMRLALRTGLAPSRFALLSVRGRRTGRTRSAPVLVLVRGADRVLVSPYGEREWVRNARHAGEVTLSRAGRSETVAVEELPPEEAAPILQQYIAEAPITRQYFPVSPDAPLSAFVRVAPRHPVFRLQARNANHSTD
jgi:deazaflavin-dependent oxidoreductase (nitroreductase family)